MQGTGMLGAPLLLLVSLGDGGISLKAIERSLDFSHALSLCSPDMATPCSPMPPYVPGSCVMALFLYAAL